MNESDQLLKNRFSELARRAYGRECYVYSDFLDMAEQDVLNKMKFDKGSASFKLIGGHEFAERRLACFGEEERIGYTESPPIVCVRISPLSRKFADTLTHRDFLGSLMALGLKRSVFGDIIINENEAHLFCLESVSSCVTEQLDKVKNTSVECAVTETPEIVIKLPEQSSVNIASERLDAMIAAVYKLSRTESQELILQGKAYVDGRLMENVSFMPSPGSIVSVRGSGRFLYEGIERETKKGRLRVLVRVF